MLLISYYKNYPCTIYTIKFYKEFHENLCYFKVGEKTQWDLVTWLEFGPPR